MKLWYLLLFVFWPWVWSVGQEQLEERIFPEYPVPDVVRMKGGMSLPNRVDNSKFKFFPDVISQYSWSCNQASSIGYTLTYELNRVRNADASLPENQYAYLYPWSFLMSLNHSNPGVSYFDTWEIVKAGGCPNLVDFPYRTSGVKWMSGYDRYYRAMFNRVFEDYSLPVGTPEDLNVLKRYLFDHFEGSPFGGIVSCQIASQGMHIQYLGKNTTDPGAPILTGFGTGVGHALTIVGYDDRIRLDLNHDGQFTNDLDINGDHLIDLNDYEKGALIAYNSWGDWLNRRGKFYIAYSVLARYGYQGGFWNRSVHLPVVARSYEPSLTMKVALRHNFRSLVRIMAGIAMDTLSTKPEHILEFPMFNFQGGSYPFFDPEGADTTRFELGLDLTPLLSYARKDQSARIFLIVDEKDMSSEMGSGKILSMTLYNHFGVEDSVTCKGLPLEIANDSRTLASVVKILHFNEIKVTPPPVVYTRPNQYVSEKLEVTGAANPFSWELDYDYTDHFTHEQFPEIDGTVIYGYGRGDLNTRIDFPFVFPFYGADLQSAYVNKDGAIVFDLESKDYPYAIDPDLVIRSRRRIVPFGKSLDYFLEDNQIIYATTDSSATVVWQAMIPTEEGSRPTRIACVMQRDGTIRFIYENPEYVFQDGGPVLLGISNGDSRMYKQLDLTKELLPDNFNTIRLHPYQFPPDTKLEPTGWLFCRPEQNNYLYDIHVKVYDKYNQSAKAVVYISTRDLDSAGLLRQNFPNPFQDRTTISFDVKERVPVRMEIFNSRGQLIKLLVDQTLPPGPYSIEWVTSGTGENALSSGTYFCRLICGEEIARIRMLKITIR